MRYQWERAAIMRLKVKSRNASSSPTDPRRLYFTRTLLGRMTNIEEHKKHVNIDTTYSIGT
jgi:hypothetical protein